MTFIDAQEGRLLIYNRDKGRCQACGNPVGWNDFQLAHRIASTMANRKRWGDCVIDHPLNRAVTCSLRCNGRMNIGMNPVKSAELAAKINEARGED